MLTAIYTTNEDMFHFFDIQKQVYESIQGLMLCNIE